MASDDDRKLFVAGLPDTITEDVLRRLFEATGAGVVSVSLPRDRATGRPRGFGFVTLATAEGALAVRQQLDGSLQSGHSISVRPFQAEPPRRGEGPAPGGPRGDRPPRDDRDRGQDRTLYVGNLPYDASQADIEGLFRERGAAIPSRIHLPTLPDGRMRGFAFVTLPTVEAIAPSLEALRDADIRGRRLMINVAHPRAERPPGAPLDGPPREARGGWDSGPPRGGEFRGPPGGGGGPPPATDDDDRRRGGAGGAADKKKRKGAGAAGEARRDRGEERYGRGPWRDWGDDE